MGYHRAGFEVVGVDIKPQPHYPFEFHQADALTYPLEGFDAYHASPPCQIHTRLNSLGVVGEGHHDLVTATRSLLLTTSRPYVIENVVGAPLLTPITLCGQMFGLRLFRHRLFETSFPLLQPGHTHGRFRSVRNKVRPRMPDNREPEGNEVWSIYGHFSNVKRAGQELGMDWMTQKEMAEAIPPAYTEYIGKYLLEALS